jgi:glycosyltransferase involved in cell wall biosynthesis
LYQDRDPRPFFRALAALQRKDGLTVSDVQVNFIGRYHSYGGESLKEITDQLGVGSLVRFTDWIPHEECQRALAEADLLLLFAQNNPNQVANKLYEYLGIRKPILAFGEADGESLQMLAQVGGHYLITQDDLKVVEGTLEKALREQPSKPTLGSEALLHEWSAQRQMAHLLSRLELG